jgi:serine/threonine-protein kinase
VVPPDEEEPSGVFDLPASADELTPEERGRVVAGRYEIVEHLGAGGMGQVLRVRHRRLGKAFALKLMRAEHSMNPEVEKIFHREAQLASQLAHPNIVEMVDFGNDPDWGWFIVMEFLEGELLSKRIELLGTLPITAACEVLAQLAEALDHSHSKHVVHADLKSENVLCLTSAADEAHAWEVKLLDFGTAQLATAISGIADHVTGTPEYMAPERITGGPPQPSSDLYALGVIMYEMLTGAPPFTGGTPTEIFERHLAEVPEPAGARRGEVLDARLDKILDKLLAKDPAQRYATARALLDDLRGYIDVLGVRQRSGLLPSLSGTDSRADAAAAAFDALGVPAAGLRRDGTIVVANPSFARLLKVDHSTIEGTSVMNTALFTLNPDLHEDLRLVALNGKVIRRVLSLERAGREIHVRMILAPTSGAAGHCMVFLHSAQ